MRCLLLLVFFAFATGPLWGQTVVIRGQATGYAGKEIDFFTIPEPVSRQPKMLAQTKVAQDGSFSLSFQTNQTIEVYTDLGKFRGTLVVEPGATYQISLPPYSPRTTLEAASPYFEPTLYWLGIAGSKPTDLNFLVRSFLTDYNKELKVHTNDLYQNKSLDTMKVIISRMERLYPDGRNDYLKILKNYSYGELACSIHPAVKEQTGRKYFDRKEVFLSHPAYQQLFNFLYAGYLTNKSQDIREKESVRKALRGDYEGFVNQLTDAGYNREPAELIAAKSFYDGYYSNKLDKGSMLRGLKSAATSGTFQPLKEAMPAILGRINSLREGSPAPKLTLKNRTGTQFNFTSKGKYIYLAFFRSDSRACRAELDSLTAIGKKLQTILTILPVSLDANTAGAIQLWNEKKYPWDLNWVADPEKAKSDYQITALPAFYLTSPDLMMVLSPALAPSHNFEPLFLKIYRENRTR